MLPSIASIARGVLALVEEPMLGEGVILLFGPLTRGTRGGRSSTAGEGVECRGGVLHRDGGGLI